MWAPSKMEGSVDVVSPGKESCPAPARLERFRSSQLQKAE